MVRKNVVNALAAASTMTVRYKLLSIFRSLSVHTQLVVGEKDPLSLSSINNGGRRNEFRGFYNGNYLITWN